LLFAASVVCAVAVYVFQPEFFSVSNLASILYYTCLVIPAVLGVHLLIVMGQFDLSVGAVASASAVITEKAVSASIGLPGGILAGVLTGLVFGLLNWLVVNKLQIPALIGTMITMGVARACSVGLTRGVTVAGLPDAFGQLAQRSFIGVPRAIVLGLFLVGTLELLSERHLLFRRFYQIGSNRRAAAANGANIPVLEGIGFILAGMGAALAGLLQSTGTLSAEPHGFPDLAFDCIAACVIGGDSLSGGVGRPTGAFLGMVIIVMSRNVVVLAGVNVYWHDLGVALVIFVAVLLNRIQRGAANV
jgi:ribose transport system permease protein